MTIPAVSGPVKTSPARPVVLSISGHDPGGGAGIQADIEAISAHNCHACTVVTALTLQDTHNVHSLIPQQTEDLIAQTRLILHDFEVKVIKIGLLGHSDAARAIADLLPECPDIPVVLDPILAAGGGARLASEALLETLRDGLLPLTSILTPNAAEARRLTGCGDDAQACGAALMEQGCQAVLMTGADEADSSVINRFFRPDHVTREYTWPRLPHCYHGSGCTLAASLAALLAIGYAPVEAVEKAQRYTWQALQAGYRITGGQYLPLRASAHWKVL